MEKSRSSSPRPHDGASTRTKPVDNTTQTTSAISPGRFWLLSLGVCLGLFLSIIDTSIVATSINDIGIEFHDVQSVNWVPLAYTLAYVACAVTFARLSDITGRRNAFVGASVVFFAFSLGCGFAQNLPQLIAFRALQGIGGSGLYSISMIVLPEVCPEGYQPVIGAMIGMVIAGSGVLGPVLGGIFTNYVTWRWIFWINGPISFASIVVFLLSWPKKDHLRTIECRSWAEFDYAGAMLVTAATVLLVFAFQNGGESSGTVWSQAVFIAPLAAGVAGWVALVAWEYVVDRSLSHRLAPAFPVGLFRNRVYASGAIATLFLGFPYLLLIYSFPLRAQIVSGQSALMAGVWLLPMLGAVAVGTMICGKANSVKDYLFESMLAGACLMTLSCGLLTTIRNSGDDGKALGFLVFAGLGYGFSTSAVTMLANFESPICDYAPAQGIIAQMRILGGSVGISMSTALVENEVRRNLPDLSDHERAILGSSDTRLSRAEQQGLHDAYSTAFRDGMVAAVAVSGAALLLTLCAYRGGGRRLVQEERKRRVQEEVQRRAARRSAV